MNVDVNGVVIDFPDNLSSDDLNKAVSQAASQMGSRTAPALDTGMRAMTGSFNPNPPNLLPKGSDVPYTSPDQAGSQVSEKIAEQGGEMGFPMAGATAGTAFYAIPKAFKTGAEMLIGGGGPASRAKEILTSGTARETAGAAIGEAEKAAGILKRAPDLKSIANDLGLPKGTNFSQLTNRMQEMVDNGEKIAPQVLRRYSDYVDLYVSKLPDKASFFKTATGSMVAGMKKLAQNTLNASVPGRLEAAAAYAKAANDYKTLQFLKQIGQKASIGVGLGAAGAAGVPIGKSILKYLGGR